MADRPHIARRLSDHHGMNPDIHFQVRLAGEVVGVFEGRGGNGVFRGDVALGTDVEPFEGSQGDRVRDIEVSYPLGSDPFTVIGLVLEEWRRQASHLRGWPL